jgi:hypothetical protein
MPVLGGEWIVRDITSRPGHSLTIVARVRDALRVRE